MGIPGKPLGNLGNPLGNYWKFLGIPRNSREFPKIVKKSSTPAKLLKKKFPMTHALTMDIFFSLMAALAAILDFAIGQKLSRKLVPWVE